MIPLCLGIGMFWFLKTGAGLCRDQAAFAFVLGRSQVGPMSVIATIVDPIRAENSRWEAKIARKRECALGWRL